MSALKRYQLLERLSHHPWAEVFAAREKKTGKRVAIKVYHRPDAASGDWEGEWQKEARTLQKLDHPNFPRVLSIQSYADLAFLVLDWVDGGVFSPRPGDSRIAQMARQAIEALTYAHSLGFVHRDLKPQHFMQDRAGRLKLIDFGLVKRSDTLRDSLPSTPVQLQWKGTPIYMAPEQIQGLSLDWRCDQFALALVFANWLGEGHPFGHPNPAVTLHRLCCEPPNWQSGNPSYLDLRRQEVLTRALARNPQDRWDSLLDFYTALFGNR